MILGVGCVCVYPCPDWSFFSQLTGEKIKICWSFAMVKMIRMMMMAMMLGHGQLAPGFLVLYLASLFVCIFVYLYLYLYLCLYVFDADAWAAGSWHIGLVFGRFQMLIQHQLQRGSATIWNTDL